MSLPNNSRYNAGFTLLELMITVSIIGILSAGMIPAFSKYIRNQNLKQAQEQLKSDLRSTQNKALTGALSDQGYSYWGMMFTKGSNIYNYFVAYDTTSCPPPSGPPPGTSQGSSKFTTGLNIQSDTGCIFFSFANGDISGIASPLIVGYSATESKQVIFNSAGLIYTTNN